MKKRDGFVLHDSTTLQFAELTDEEVALLMRAMLAYHFEGKESDFKDRVLKIVFADFRRRYDNDSEKYLKRCEKNRANANKRWNAMMMNKELEGSAVVIPGAQNNPKTTPNVNDNDNDNGNVNENENTKFNPKSLSDTEQRIVVLWK